MNTYSKKYPDEFVNEVLDRYITGHSLKSLKKNYHIQIHTIKLWAMKANVYVEKPIYKQMYGWSKWGGANEGLVKEELDIWHCQSCSEPQAKSMAQYMIPLDESKRDFARVCSKCKKVGIAHDIKIFCDLIKYTRNKSTMEKIYESIDDMDLVDLIVNV